MQDPILDRSIEEAKELATRWSQFHDFFRMGVKGENLSAQAELKFLEVKMRVAMLHGGFVSYVKHDQKVAQNMIGIMASCILLKRLKGMNQTELQKLEYDWNEAYLLISETISQLEEDREELASVSQTAYKLRHFRKNFARNAVNFLRSPVFIIGLVLFAFIAVVIGAPMMGYYDITKLKTQAPAVRGLYDPVMNTLRIAFPDIPYSDPAEFPMGDTTFGREDPEGANALELRAGEQVQDAINRGFATEQIPDIIRIITKNKGGGTAVYILPGDRRIISRSAILSSVADAKRLLELRRENMQNNLNQERRLTIDQHVTFARRANMVVTVELSTPEARKEFLEKRYGFKDSEIGL